MVGGKSKDAAQRCTSWPAARQYLCRPTSRCDGLACLRFIAGSRPHISIADHLLPWGWVTPMKRSGGELTLILRPRPPRTSGWLTVNLMPLAGIGNLAVISLFISGAAFRRHESQVAQTFAPIGVGDWTQSLLRGPS